MSEMRLIISCEHAGNAVPSDYRNRFESPRARRWLNSHRGWDIGALSLAERIAERLDAPLFATSISRLVVEANRTLESDTLFSPFTAEMTECQKARLLEEHYHPFRRRVEEATRAISKRSIAVHLSVHTFTPRYRGRWRPLEIGILFDPERPAEQRFSNAWIDGLRRDLPHYRIEPNQPYLGIDDGHTTALRRLFADDRYLGIELEINQRLLQQREAARTRLEEALVCSLGRLLQMEASTELSEQ